MNHKYKVIQSSKFKKDYKRAKKRGLDMGILKYAIMLLADGLPLPENFHDHDLIGNYTGYRECHLQPDWLLVYKYTEEELVINLHRTGSHSDIF